MHLFSCSSRRFVEAYFFRYRRRTCTILVTEFNKLFIKHNKCLLGLCICTKFNKFQKNTLTFNLLSAIIDMRLKKLNNKS